MDWKVLSIKAILIDNKEGRIMAKEGSSQSGIVGEAEENNEVYLITSDNLLGYDNITFCSA